MKKGYLTTSDNARVYFEDQGAGDAILFIPGHMCTTKFYKNNTPYFLEKGFRVVSIDSRGYGNSSKPLYGNCVDRHADDIKELIDYLGLENVTLIGWSLSGSIVTTYAHKYNGYKLKSLGLIDSCLFPFSPDSWNTYNAKNYNMDNWNETFILQHTNLDQFVENFVSRFRSELTPEDELMIASEIRKTPPWISLALHSDWCHTDATAYLPEINVPVIIFSGESKGHGYAMGRYYKTILKTYCELHEFEKGGHVLFYSCSEQFNNILEAFIAKL